MTEVILLIVGFLAGAVNAVAAGGALIAFPAMLYAGLSPLSATITSTLVVWPGQLSALAASKKDLIALPKKYWVLVVPGLSGGIIGALFLNSTSNDTFNTIIPWLLTFTVILFIVQPFMHKHIHQPVHMRRQISTIAVWTSIFAVSIYAGYFGFGSGLMMLTLLGFTRIKTIFQVIALKNLIGVVISVSFTTFFTLQHKIAWDTGLILAVGSIAGGYFGARYCHNIPQYLIRLLIAIIGIILVIICFNKF